MKFCSNCGNKFNESDKFCSNCGQSKGIDNSIKSVEKEKTEIYVPTDLTEDEIGKYIDSELISDFYKGELLNGKKHGHGILMNSDWDVSQNDFVEYKEYEGDFKYDKKDGFGVEYNIDGAKVYEGNWKDDKYNGAGRWYSGFGMIESNFVDGQTTDGLTKVYYHNLNIRISGYLEGYIWNNAKWYDIDGTLFYEGGISGGLGVFENNQFNGEGTLYEDDGTIIKGIWENGELVSNFDKTDDPLGLRNNNDPLRLRDDVDPLGLR
jgi:hypothetical protein